uniref:Uncharacterized protein n=1 Tax=Mycena chlorophos TaxID=658473 RepID=A0ABQ0LDN9_MYCCL|nr:predicted protein [Mycena chlorophos]
MRVPEQPTRPPLVDGSLNGGRARQKAPSAAAELECKKPADVRRRAQPLPWTFDYLQRRSHGTRDCCQCSVAEDDPCWFVPGQTSSPLTFVVPGHSSMAALPARRDSHCGCGPEDDADGGGAFAAFAGRSDELSLTYVDILSHEPNPLAWRIWMDLLVRRGGGIRPLRVGGLLSFLYPFTPMRVVFAEGDVADCPGIAHKHRLQDFLCDELAHLSPGRRSRREVVGFLLVYQVLLTVALKVREGGSRLARLQLEPGLASKFLLVAFSSYGTDSDVQTLDPRQESECTFLRVVRLLGPMSAQPAAEPQERAGASRRSSVEANQSQ